MAVGRERRGGILVRFHSVYWFSFSLSLIFFFLFLLLLRDGLFSEGVNPPRLTHHPHPSRVTDLTKHNEIINRDKGESVKGGGWGTRVTHNSQKKKKEKEKKKKQSGVSPEWIGGEIPSPLGVVNHPELESKPAAHKWL
eukprot:TRINITY_DN4232_c0_g1_i1.p1 TRINITY_DN4232_c0_g1~~TRINITY_DN4232_c0_g1_i1.p1  ORF type:complete len:139 (-),score=12.93 TRINITY_DN4232_c0_g1_i1:490-906(-)